MVQAGGSATVYGVLYQMLRAAHWAKEIQLKATINGETLTSSMFGVAWHTVSEVDLARLKKLPRPQLSGLKRLAIDENYLGTRHGFVSVVLDLDSTAIVSVWKGRGKAALAPFFSRLKQAKAKVVAWVRHDTWTWSSWRTHS